jgi:hypothetical protein
MGAFRGARVEFVAVGRNDERVARVRVERNDGQAHRAPRRYAMRGVRGAGAASGSAYGSESDRSLGPVGESRRRSSAATATDCTTASSTLPPAGSRAAFTTVPHA